MTGLIKRTDVGAMLESGKLYKTYEVRDMLNNAPDVIVREVTSGTWTEYHIDCNGYGMIKYQHRECAAYEGSSALHSCPFPICPYCGASMHKSKG